MRLISRSFRLFVPALAVLTVAVGLFLAGCSCCQTGGASCCATDDTAAAQAKSGEATRAKKTEPKDTAVLLFNGKDLTGWKSSQFGGDGVPRAEDGQLILPVGEVLTGVTYTKGDDLPRVNYEIEFDAMRVDGTDFFGGITFPYKDTYASLIVGGWGGGVAGISSIDGLDASENETTSYQEFEKNKWYHVRLRVLEDKFEAWLDKEKIVDVNVKDRRVDIRPEVELSKPLGFASFQTTAALKNIKMRKIEP